jgi:hypothetical protein
MKRILLMTLCVGILSTLGGCYIAPYPYDGTVSVGVGTAFYYSPSWGYYPYYPHYRYYRPSYPYYHHHYGHHHHGHYYRRWHR